MAFRGLVDDGGNRCCRRSDDCKIDPFRDSSEARVAKDSLNMRPLGVDGVNRAAKRALQEIAHQDVANMAPRGACANYSDGGGLEERIQRSDDVSQGASSGKE